jgi:hypothetical protein
MAWLNIKASRKSGYGTMDLPIAWSSAGGIVGLTDLLGGGSFSRIAVMTLS